MIHHCSAGTRRLLLISLFISAANSFVLQRTDPKTDSQTPFNRALDPRPLASFSRPAGASVPPTWSNTIPTHHSRELHGARKLQFGPEFDENINEIEALESESLPPVPISVKRTKDPAQITPLSFAAQDPCPKVPCNSPVPSEPKPLLVQIPPKVVAESIADKRGRRPGDNIESVPLRPVHTQEERGEEMEKSGNAGQVLVTVVEAVGSGETPTDERNKTISFTGTESPLQTFLHQLPTPSTPFTSSVKAEGVNEAVRAREEASAPSVGHRPKGPHNTLKKPNLDDSPTATVVGVFVISLLTLAWLTKARDDYFAQIPQLSAQPSVLSRLWERSFQEDYSRPFYWPPNYYQQKPRHPYPTNYRTW